MLDRQFIDLRHQHRICYSRSLLYFLLFFFKQKTAYEVRISDWSSDVCSSDLPSHRHIPRAMNASPTPDLALYVHWPFCVSKCPYCDFNSHVRDSVDQDLWRRGLLADLAHEATQAKDRKSTV